MNHLLLSQFLSVTAVFSRTKTKDTFCQSMFLLHVIFLSFINVIEINNFILTIIFHHSCFTRYQNKKKFLVANMGSYTFVGDAVILPLFFLSFSFVDSLNRKTTLFSWLYSTKWWSFFKEKWISCVTNKKNHISLSSWLFYVDSYS